MSLYRIDIMTSLHLSKLMLGTNMLLLNHFITAFERELPVNSTKLCKIDEDNECENRMKKISNKRKLPSSGLHVPNANFLTKKRMKRNDKTITKGVSFFFLPMVNMFSLCYALCKLLLCIATTYAICQCVFCFR